MQLHVYLDAVVYIAASLLGWRHVSGYWNGRKRNGAATILEIKQALAENSAPQLEVLHEINGGIVKLVTLAEVAQFRKG